MSHTNHSSAAAIGSAINLEYVRAVVAAGNGEGMEEVQSFHRSLFLQENGIELERFRQQRRIHEEKLSDLESRLSNARDRLEGQDPHVPVMESGNPDVSPNAPWNGWDRCMFIAGAIGILGLLTFGIFNISFNLLESGIVTFTENPVRAYLWTALLPVGAFALKIGWDVLESSGMKSKYLWGCLLVGLISMLTWIAAYAGMYPTLSMSTEERISRLTVENPNDPEWLGGINSYGVKKLDMILVTSQALAEICLSAALGIYLTKLYTKHRPVRLADNPTFVQFDRLRTELEDRIAQERLALAQAKGGQERLEHQLSAFVAYARSLYQRESALRSDRSQQKRQLLDQITEQLKSKLAAADEDRFGEDEETFSTPKIGARRSV